MMDKLLESVERKFGLGESFSDKVGYYFDKHPSSSVRPNTVDEEEVRGVMENFVRTISRQEETTHLGYEMLAPSLGSVHLRMVGAPYFNWGTFQDTYGPRLLIETALFSPRVKPPPGTTTYTVEYARGDDESRPPTTPYKPITDARALREVYRWWSPEESTYLSWISKKLASYDLFTRILSSRSMVDADAQDGRGHCTVFTWTFPLLGLNESSITEAVGTDWTSLGDDYEEYRVETLELPGIMLLPPAKRNLREFFRAVRNKIEDEETLFEAELLRRGITAKKSRMVNIINLNTMYETRTGRAILSIRPEPLTYATRGSLEVEVKYLFLDLVSNRERPGIRTAQDLARELTR
jgi:hypothetical protein